MKFAWKYYVAVSAASLCGMAIEMAAARILAPFFGTSQMVWGILIGVVLAAMSAGSYIGGRIADKTKDTEKTIANLLSVAAFCIIAVGVLKNVLLAFLSLIGLWGGVVASIVFFAPVSVLFSMITPLVIKVIQNAGGGLGQNVGRIYAISTVGSIIGTFATSFVFLPLIGNAWTVVVLAVIAAGAAMLFRWKYLLQIVALISACALSIYPISTAALFMHAVEEVDTVYGNYLITDDGKTVSIQVHNAVESMKRKGSNELLSEYIKYYDLGFHVNPNIQTALCIGGAGYCYPQYFVEKYPAVSIDVVEIDPAMERIAKKYFELQTSERLVSIIQDGRAFLNSNTKKYDVILGDAFKSKCPPYECLTVEATEKIYSGLSDNGVYIVNIITSETGINSRLLKSYYNTLESVFPHVYSFAVGDRARNQNGNKILLAAKQPVELTSGNGYYQKMLETRFTVEDNNLPVLTDDRAPVDFYTMFY